MMLAGLCSVYVWRCAACTFSLQGRAAWGPHPLDEGLTPCLFQPVPRLSLPARVSAHVMIGDNND